MCVYLELTLGHDDQPRTYSQFARSFEFKSRIDVLKKIDQYEGVVHGLFILHEGKPIIYFYV